MLWGKVMYKELINLASIFKSGFTVNVEGNTIEQFNQKSGFIVSCRTVIKIKGDKVNYVGSIPNKGILGGWYNAVLGEYLIEVNKVYKDISTALKRARELKQVAIWDIEKGKEVLL